MRYHSAKRQSPLPDTMKPPRFYHPRNLVPGSCVALEGEEARHAARVLRLREGDAAVVFDGMGLALSGTVLSVSGNAVVVSLGDEPLPSRESSLRTILLQAVGKGAKTDFAVEKAVELGVSAMVPFFAARGDVKPIGERHGKRAERWKRIALAACKQCGRARIPDIAEPAAFAEALRAVEAERKFILHPAGEAIAFDGAPPRGGIAVAVGPEGGFTEDEIAEALRTGFARVSLGPRVMRTETAGAAFLAAAQAAWGDWRAATRP